MICYQCVTFNVYPNVDPDSLMDRATYLAYLFDDLELRDVYAEPVNYGTTRLVLVWERREEEKDDSHWIFAQMRKALGFKGFTQRTEVTTIAPAIFEAKEL